MVKALLWWTTSTTIAIFSIFFLFFGIDLCRAAYQLNHPYHFVLTFFASNLIILISVVLLAGVVVRVVTRLRHGQTPPNV